MNLLSFKTVKSCTRSLLFLLAFFSQVSVRAWDVDLTRRQKDLKSMRMPASIVDQPQKSDEGLVASFFESTDPMQEIVILNTEKGFVPAVVQLRKGRTYKVIVVNVNSKEKNTSFILDAFSEHHATYFGEEQAFSIAPKAD